MSIDEKSYNYMMDTLRRIIRRVEEVSTDWWWFEQGAAPVIQVRRLVTDGEVKLDWTPKVSVIRALKIILDNFDRIVGLPQEKRLDVAIKSAQDLYAVLLAVTYIIEAHDLAEKLNSFRERISKVRPDILEEFVEEMRKFITRLKDALLRNVMSWPNIRDEFVGIVDSMIKNAEKIIGEKPVVVHEEKVKKEMVGA